MTAPVIPMPNDKPTSDVETMRRHGGYIERVLELDRVQHELSRDEIAQIVEHFMHGLEWTAGKRPTIAELEAILQSGDTPSIKILPDGSITAAEPREEAFRCADMILSCLPPREPTRAQVVEECARVVEMQEPISQVHRSPYGFGYFKCREDAAAAIRALALPRGSEGK